MLMHPHTKHINWRPYKCTLEAMYEIMSLQVIRQAYGKLHGATNIYAIDVLVRIAACQAHIELIGHWDGQTADTSMPCLRCMHDSYHVQSNAMIEEPR